MDQWILLCAICGEEFPHSSIPEKSAFAEAYLPTKPQFPPQRPRSRLSSVWTISRLPTLRFKVSRPGSFVAPRCMSAPVKNGAILAGAGRGQ